MKLYSIKKSFFYLAISYCFTVSIVSSMVLLHSVFTDDTKKFSALIKVSPFLVRLFWVSELYKNSSWSSGDLWARSLKHSPKALYLRKVENYFIEVYNQVIPSIIVKVWKNPIMDLSSLPEFVWRDRNVRLKLVTISKCLHIFFGFLLKIQFGLPTLNLQFAKIFQVFQTRSDENICKWI